MADVVDVAEHILARSGEMTAMKLHKLLYFSQAWHLVWEGTPLFDDEVQAWANGPVIPSLYAMHRGLFTVPPGHFYEVRRRARRAQLNLAIVDALRTLVPTNTAVRAVRKKHRAAARAAALASIAQHPMEG